MKKRSVLLILVAALVLSCLAVPTFAAEEGGTYEVALLIDVSGSMNQADPQRISIEAAKAFAYYHPSQAEYFKISVVLYNTDVLTVVNSVDVSKENGMNAYQNTLDAIGKLDKSEKYQNFTTWAKDTDIGSAIVEAEKILGKSSAQKKAVILFTDGKIDLDNNFSVTTDGEKKSEENSFSCAEKFAQAGIPMYTVGLNYNNGVDKAYMQKLANMTEGQFLCCTGADQLMPFFQDMYAYFVGGTFTGGDTVTVKPNVESKHQVNIYGQAISEANLVLFSSAVIETFTVTNPNGVVIAKGTSDGKFTSDDSCVINRNDLTVNVKLLKPADGNWTISFTSQTSGTVQIGEIYLYQLKVVNDSPDTVTVGSPVTFQPVLFNEDTDSRITTQAIYENSTCTVTVTSNGSSEVHQAKLNSAKNGYTLELDFDTPGDYDISYYIKNEQFDENTVGKLHVLAPGMSLSTDTTACERGQQVRITGQLMDTLTSDAMDLPGYLAGGTCTAEVKRNGEKVDTITGTYQEEGKFLFTYSPDAAGDYEISATVQRYDDTVTSGTPVTFTVWWPELMIQPAKESLSLGDGFEATVVLRNPATSEEIPISDYVADQQLQARITLEDQEVANIDVEVSDTGIGFDYTPEKVGTYTVTVSGTDFSSEALTFTVNPSDITSKEALSDVTGSVLFGDVTREVDLGKLFTDSDGDSLSFAATAQGEGLEVKVENGVLTLTAQGGAEGTVTVKVSDGRGAEYTASFHVTIKSMMPLFITLMVLVAVAAVATPIVIIVVNKRRIPRIKYRVKLVLNPNSGRKVAIFEVARASGNRRCKSVMTLKDILNITTLTSQVSSEMSDDELRSVISEFGSKVTVSGFVFKEGLKIQAPGNKAKAFTSSITSVQVKSGKENDPTVVQIYFGKTTAF